MLQLSYKVSHEWLENLWENRTNNGNNALLAPAYESCYTTVSLRITQGSSWVKEQGSDLSVITMDLSSGIFDLWNVLRVKMSQSISFESMKFKNEPLCVSFSLFRVIRVSSITEQLFSPPDSYKNTCTFYCLDDVTHLQPIRSIVRWQGLVTGSSSWLILFIPEHKSHVCFYLFHGGAWN